MSFIKTATTAISNNRETIKRKTIVAVGTAVGMLLASSVIDRLNEPSPEIIYIEVPVEATDESLDTPSE